MPDNKRVPGPGLVSRLRSQRTDPNRSYRELSTTSGEPSSRTASEASDVPKSGKSRLEVANSRIRERRSIKPPDLFVNHSFEKPTNKPKTTQFIKRERASPVKDIGAQSIKQGHAKTVKGRNDGFEEDWVSPDERESESDDSSTCMESSDEYEVFTDSPEIATAGIKESDEDDDDCVRRRTTRSGTITLKKESFFDSPPLAGKSPSPPPVLSQGSTANERDASVELGRNPSCDVHPPPESPALPLKRRLRSTRHAAQRDNSPSTSGYDSSGRPRRYPRRAGRALPGSFAPLCPIDISDITSSDGDGPAKKKIKRANQGAARSDNSFEPTIYFPVKEISFETVGGYSSIKEELRRSVVIPFRQRIQVDQLNKTSTEGIKKTTIEMTRGALFWGPPGTGKTLMAKALAYECSKDLGDRPFPVYIISGAELLTKWVGESESHLREIFHHASENCPSIIFMDELDGLVRKRTNSDNDSVNFNMVSTLLTLLNGATDRGTVLAIATTNFKEVLDPALLRSGRFDLKIHFPSPVESERALILQAITKNWTRKLDEVQAMTLARNTAGFTGADLDLLCKKAKNIACQRQIEPISNDIPLEIETDVLLCDFFGAWQEVEPSGGAAAVVPYEPLTPLLQPLFKLYVEALYSEVVRSFSIRTATHTSASAHLETAAWAAFSQPGLLLGYDPVLFIHSDGDPVMLDLVVSALFHCLAEKNTAKTVNFKSATANERSLAGDVNSGLRDRTGVLGLLRIDLACAPKKNDRFQLVDSVYSVLEHRDKLRCPLLIITSIYPLSSYGKSFRKLLGPGCKQFFLNAIDQPTSLLFFQDLFFNEAVRTAREDGQMVEIPVPGARNLFNKAAIDVSQKLAGKKVEDFLFQHQRLSAALNHDRTSDHKPTFEHTVKCIVEEFKNPGDSSSEESAEEESD